jgi:serine/threonine protein kinase
MSAPPNPLAPPLAQLALTEHDALPAGTRFGEFEVIRVLGVGGFGIVYLAQDHSLERQVALKEYMPAALAARGAGAMVSIRSSSFAETYAVGLRSFVNEARLLARFDHASLVKVYRFWEDNGTAYMVMPYLQGRNLRDARRQMGAAPDEAWIRAVLTPLLDALQLLHDEGVFHRDIAPDNILLPPAAPPILLDFGAARRVISDRTQSLTAILKPSYAPIEQYAEMTAMRQGPWTDLYALGAVLHFMLFGEPPAPATARAVQPDDEPLAQRAVAGVSPRFVGIVAWMLGVRPRDRPQSVAALRRVLDGEMPIPLPGPNDVTLPSAATLLPVADPSTAAPRGGAEAAAAAMRLDTAHQPTVPMTTPPAPTASPVRSAPSGPAPMRSTPPGKPPPSYVPPPRMARPAIAAPLPVVADASGSRRRGAFAIGIGAAVVAGIVVLGALAGIVGRARPSAAPLAAASAASPPPAARAASAAPKPAESTFATVSAPETQSMRATPIELQASGIRPTSERRSHAPAIRLAPSAAPRRSDVAVSSGPASAREACGNRNFVAQAICIESACERPRFRATPECLRIAENRRQRAER